MPLLTISIIYDLNSSTSLREYSQFVGKIDDTISKEAIKIILEFVTTMYIYDKRSVKD